MSFSETILWSSKETSALFAGPLIGDENSQLSVSLVKAVSIFSSSGLNSTTFSASTAYKGISQKVSVVQSTVVRFNRSSIWRGARQIPSPLEFLIIKKRLL